MLLVTFRWFLTQVTNLTPMKFNPLLIKINNTWNSNCIYGGGDRRQQIQLCREGGEIVVATPGRFNDLKECGKIDVSDVTYMVRLLRHNILYMNILTCVTCTCNNLLTCNELVKIFIYIHSAFGKYMILMITGWKIICIFINLVI